MKHLLLCAAFACVAVVTIAAPVQKGIYEVQAGVDWEVLYNGYDKVVPLRAGLGYYCTDQVQVGGLLSFSKKEGDSFWGVSDVWGIGGFCEYNFTGNDTRLPYAGGSLSFYDGGDDVVTVLAAFGGIKYFVLPTVALFGQINLMVATDEIYDFDRNWLIQDQVKGDGQNFGASVGAGVRVELW